MIKNALLGLLFVVLLLAGLLVFSSSATLRMVNLVLPADIKIRCLTHNFRSWHTVEIAQICVQAPQFTLEGSGFRWAITQRQLSGQLIAIELLNGPVTPDVNVKTLPNIAIPEMPTWTPDVHIEQVQVSSSVLTQPLRFSVQLTERRRLKMWDQWQLEANLEQGQVYGTLQWQLSDLSALLPADWPSQLAASLEPSSLLSDFRFDGNLFHATTSVDVALPYTVTDCQLLLTGTGALRVSYSLRDHAGQLDASEFSSRLSALQCPVLDTLPMPADDVIDAVQLIADHPIDFTLAGAELASVRLRASGKLSADMRLNNLTLNQQGLASGGFTFQARMGEAATFTGMGNLDLDNSNVRVHLAQSELRLTDFIWRDLRVESLLAKLQGRFDQVLTGHVNIEATAVSFGQAQASRIQANVSISDQALTDLTSQFTISVASIPPPANGYRALGGCRSNTDTRFHIHQP